MTAKANDHGFLINFILLMIVVVGLAVLVGCLPWRLGSTWFGGEVNLKTRLEMLGTFGDLFGFLNAIFSGVAFAAIYSTFKIQQKQHDIQELELSMKKEVACLVVDEEESKNSFQTMVPGGPRNQGDDRPRCPANYVRLVLKNNARMPARNCRVMLTAIEKKRPGEQFAIVKESKITLRFLQPTEIDNAEEDRGCTIPHNLPHYFNVCSIKSEPPDHKPFGLLQVAHWESKYKHFGDQFELGCEYRFHISVDSENSTPLSVKMTVSIGRELDNIQVHDIQVDRKTGIICYAD